MFPDSCVWHSFGRLVLAAGKSGALGNRTIRVIMLRIRIAWELERLPLTFLCLSARHALGLRSMLIPPCLDNLGCCAIVSGYTQQSQSSLFDLHAIGGGSLRPSFSQPPSGPARLWPAPRRQEPLYQQMVPVAGGWSRLG